MKPRTQVVTLAILLLVASAAPIGQQPGITRVEETLVVNQQQIVKPGYAVGNIAIGDPKVADFRVMPGRREVLLFGKGPGNTTLTIWDQKNVARHQIVITVATQEAVSAERDLRELLKKFPTVEVRRALGSLTVTGDVESKEDFAAIRRIADAARARNLVRYTGKADEATPAVPANPPQPAVQYEIELFEASAQYRSGSYATGVEPSGRSLFKGTAEAAFGAEGQIFIGGTAVTGAQKKSEGDSKKTTNAQQKPVETGIRLRLRPSNPDAAGRFTTFVLVETNLPIASDTYDPAVWRRARWEFAAASGEPFGVTGGDLLATPDATAPSGGKNAGRAVSVATGLPGASRVPGLQYVPVFGSLFGSRSYKGKQTQLLVVLRPRVITPGQR